MKQLCPEWTIALAHLKTTKNIFLKRKNCCFRSFLFCQKSCLLEKMKIYNLHSRFQNLEMIYWWGKKINHSLHSICCKILMLYMYLNVIWMPEQKVKYYVNGLNIIFFMRKIFNKKSKITGWRRCKIDIKSPFIPLALILSAVTLSMVDHCSGNIWLL